MEQPRWLIKSEEYVGPITWGFLGIDRLGNAAPSKLGKLKVVLLIVWLLLNVIAPLFQLYSWLMYAPKEELMGYRFSYNNYNREQSFCAFHFDIFEHGFIYDRDLHGACWEGDLEFVSQCIPTAEFRDSAKYDDWEKMMKIAFHRKHMDIVRCIRNSGIVSLDKQLYYSCLLGDQGFVSQCIAEHKDIVHFVDWERLMKTAYDKKHIDIIHYIRDSGQMSLMRKLYFSCLLGDLEFVSQCIAEDRDRGQNVDWERLMKTAYYSKHMDIVRCIWDSGQVSLRRRLHCSCQYGDLKFVSQCIAEGRDRGQNVNWDRLMKTAYERKHMDIVRCIRDYRFGSLGLYYSCLLGDLEFVSQCIAEDRDSEQNVNWDRLMDIAYGRKHMDIVRCIRDYRRVPLMSQLYYSYLLGDLGFVSQCVAEDRDRGQDAAWDWMMTVAYYSMHMDILRCIRDSGRGSVNKQLYYSCLLGDLEFVSQCIAQGRDRGQNVEWNRLMKTAYGRKHMDIVRCIRDSGRVPLEIPKHLKWACELGDLEFVSLCIAEDRDRGQNVDWKRLMTIAYDNKNMDIARVIVQSGRLTLADMKYAGYEKVLFVIKHTVDVNKEIRPGFNTLHVACYISASEWNTDIKNALEIINAVLNKEAEINRKGYMGRTALHFLCHGENTDIDDIIDIDVDNLIEPITEFSPDHSITFTLQSVLTETDESKEQSVKKSNLCIGGKISESIVNKIKNVIKEGSEVNATDANGQTPLHLLCLSEGDVSIGTVLIEKGANIDARDNEGRTPLAVAAQHDNEKFVSFLCEKGCDKNTGNFLGETPLYLSAVANNIRSAKILRDEKVNVNQANEYNVTPLAAACEHNNHHIVGLLLKYADPGTADMEERTALHKVAMYGSTESCKRLMRANIDLDAKDITGFTAFHLAIIGHQLPIIKVLLDHKCNIHVANNLGNTALHSAVSTYNENNVSKGNKSILEILLQKGSYIDHRNNYGHTPLMLSANALDFTMMKCLYDKKATLGVVNNMQRGLIHIVVVSHSEICLQQDRKHQKCQVIIKWLIERGLSINASDVNKQTPLHLAAKQGEPKLVSFLVDRGSDVTIRDTFNHMPLVNALEHPEVFQYLWERTLPAITADDVCKLQRLCHWFDISEKMNEHAPIVIEMINMPQNVRKLKLRYDDTLEKWLRTEKEELPEFMANWLPSLQALTYIEHPTINKVMWEFLNDLQEGVKKEDPFVAYVITRCGSVEEKTKAFAQDENDCSCVLQNIRFEMFEPPTEADHPVWDAFVHLVCKEEYYDHLKGVLDGKKRLSQGKLCHHFGKAIGNVVANPAFWAKYPQLQRISAKDISAGDRRICTMHVIWSDEICPWLKIDIDLAPVIDLSKWKPSWCRKHPLLDEIECIALPKWKMTPKVNMDLMEIGVHSWGPLFHKMPEEMRQGYRLAKVVRGSAVCPQIPQFLGEAFVPEAQFLDLPKTYLMPNELEEWSNASEFMNTYLLKQVIMHEYTTWYDQKMDGLDPPVHTDVYWARRIYEKMEEAFKRRELYSWFIPTYNLMNDDKFVQFQETAILYARLCRRLLTEEAADHFRKAYLGGS